MAASPTPSARGSLADSRSESITLPPPRRHLTRMRDGERRTKEATPVPDAEEPSAQVPRPCARPAGTPERLVEPGFCGSAPSPGGENRRDTRARSGGGGGERGCFRPPPVRKQ